MRSQRIGQRFDPAQLHKMVSPSAGGFSVHKRFVMRVRRPGPVQGLLAQLRQVREEAAVRETVLCRGVAWPSDSHQN